MLNAQPAPPLYLGMAMWANPDWRGSLLPAHGDVELADYAGVFNAVEGNTTFYSGIPKAETVAAWAEQAPDTFRFCFKLPGQLTHAKRLRDIDDEFTRFIQRLSPLGDRLGPLMVQLPRDFGQAELPALEQLLTQWPSDIPCGVEVRHGDFFHKGTAEQRFNRLLISQDANRIMLDVRALFATPAGVDNRLAKAQEEKPKVPLHVLSTAVNPVIRFIGHFDDAVNDARFTPWIERLVLWIKQGKTPFLFVHTPDNRLAPELARRCYARLAERIALPPLAAFAGEHQVSLF
ncbi:DUF72 domain-containing protein [Salinicola avicenniae]|uniref:DUF72 domain-containing protein n=1 Tax=Salinicola avicenniae TaxID=2916836 RepID=UPI002074A10E|nr:MULTISPECIES: DUF72 domain-containing protein [unclassified Salinicola]